MAKLNQAQSAELEAVAAEIDAASTWVTGARASKLAALKDRILLVAAGETPDPPQTGDNADQA